MIDRHTLAKFRQRPRSQEDVMIGTFKETSGAVKALFFSNSDRCFYVTVNGRERIRSDSPEIIAEVFNEPQPEQIRYTYSSL